MNRLRISKKGHIRRAYRRRGGTLVGSTRVGKAGFFIRDRGKKGRGKKVIKVKSPGSLKQFGYKYTDPEKKRRRALRKIARHIREGGIRKGEEQRYLGKVGAGAIWFKKTKPAYAKRARADKKYLSKQVPRISRK